MLRFLFSVPHKLSLSVFLNLTFSFAILSNLSTSCDQTNSWITTSDGPMFLSRCMVFVIWKYLNTWWHVTSSRRGWCLKRPLKIHGWLSTDFSHLIARSSPISFSFRKSSTYTTAIKVQVMDILQISQETIIVQQELSHWGQNLNGVLCPICNRRKGPRNFLSLSLWSSVFVYSVAFYLETVLRKKALII